MRFAPSLATSGAGHTHFRRIIGMSILVTGGAGFIGSHLIERLCAETSERLICLDDFNDFYDSRLKRANVRCFSHREGVTIVEGSFLNRDAMRQLFAEQQVQCVFHLGAYAGVRASVAQPLEFAQANVLGTLV